MRKPYSLQFVVAAGALGLALFAGTAGAATVIFDFSERQTEHDSRFERSLDGTFTFNQGGITLRVTAGGSGANPASNPILIRNRAPLRRSGAQSGFVGEFGVVSAGQEFTHTDARIQRGESLILSFSQTVTLRSTTSFDLDRDTSDFLGRDRGHFYVLRSLDGAGGAGEVALENTVSVPIQPTVTGRRFELFIRDVERDLFGSQDPIEFGFFLGAIEVQPIPEPSTALLTGAGLFALGFAGARRRRV